MNKLTKSLGQVDKSLKEAKINQEEAKNEKKESGIITKFRKKIL